MSTPAHPLAAIKEAMFTYFTQTAGLAPETVSDGSVLVESLDLDSLAIIEMLWDVEEKFGVHIDDVASLKNMSLDQVADVLAQALTTAPGPAAGTPLTPSAA